MKCAKEVSDKVLYTHQIKAIVHLMKHKRLLLGLSTGPGKSTIFQVTDMLVGGVCLVIVPLLALGANQSSQLKNKYCMSINLDEVRKFEVGTSKLGQKSNEYTSSKNIVETVYLFLLPQTLKC